MELTGSHGYGLLLAACTLLLFFRVAGQLVVFFLAPRWLPPMAQWQSGLLPYPVLLVSQAVVLTFMTLISRDFLRGSGYFVAPHHRAAMFSLTVSALYFSGMVLRYVVRMRRRPDQRWLGGTIPIVFHAIVAIFLWAWGWYQFTR